MLDQDALMAEYPPPMFVTTSASRWAFWCGCIQAELSNAHRRIADLEAANTDLQAQIEERGSYAEA